MNTGLLTIRKIVNRSLPLMILIAGVSLSACGWRSSASKVKDTESAQRAARAGILTRLQQSVEQKRQGQATIQVLDIKGQPVQGLRVVVDHLAHDFNLGCRLNSRDLPGKEEEYRNRFQKVFNTVVITPAGSQLTKEQTSDADLEWARASAKQIIGSLLIASEEGMAKTVSVRSRVQETIKRYRGKISLWQITHGDAIFTLSTEAALQNFREAITAAREADPQVKLIISADGVFNESPEQRDRFFQLLTQLTAENIVFDGVGVEASGTIHSVNKREWMDPLVIAAALERLAAFKKPIHILDLSAPANQFVEISGKYRQGNWDVFRQDEYVREVLMLCLSNAEVVSFSFRKFMDEDIAVAGNGINEDGLIDHQYNPRPVWQRLGETLGSKLHVTHQLLSKRDGNSFRGFYGDYKVKVFLPDNDTVEKKFSLQRDQKNEWFINLPGN